MIQNAGPEVRIPGARKAAMLIIMMGEEISSEVLRNLSED